MSRRSRYLLSSRFYSFAPVGVVLLVAILLVGVVLYSSGGDILSLVRIGTRFSTGNPSGTEGYDGQFVYYIARNPSPHQVAKFLDVPAYRYQRILYPIIVRGLSFGNEQAIPWIMVLVNIIAIAAGTWALGELFNSWGVSRWYALVYGLWTGFLLALIVDLSEPLAYGLVAGAVLAIERDKTVVGWVLFGLAVFAKEVTLIFVLAALLAYSSQRQWKQAALLGMIAVIPYALFQIWLWGVFGQPGIGSGGAMATPFEIVPLMGLMRIGNESVLYLLAMSVVFFPTIILPSLWGIWKSGVLLLSGERGLMIFGLLLNALVILFLPFSTFRETGGLLRYACGLVLAVLLLAGRYRLKRVLNYSIFWIVLNVFLLKSI